MSVKTTQLHGMSTQIYSWIEIINEMEGYEATDYNNLYELESALEEALNQIEYELRSLSER